jgi:two-component system LytT family response regulator
MRILLVDDEAPARARLRRLLGELPGTEVVGEAASGADAVAAIGELAPDLVLLDIQMPGLDGFDVIDAVGVEAMPPVVFVTAYDEHALRAFEARALDYLLKPVGRDRLADAVERARRLASPAPTPDGDMAARLDGLLRELGRRARPLRHLMVQHGERSLLVPVDRIVRLAADRNYVRVFVAGAEYRVRGTIAAIEQRLDPAAFLRISRGDVVRLDAVRELHPWSHGDYHVILHDGTRLVWSRRFRGRGGLGIG